MNIDEMQAGPELDALVAERVMGWRQSSLPGVFIDEDERFWGVTDEVPTSRQFNPSIDIATAWQVWQKLPRIHSMGNHDLSISWHLINARSIHRDGNEYIVCGILDCGEWEYSASADTAPLAICRAALEAVTR